MAETIYILNGPNLNLLGKREPEIYGSETLADIAARCKAKAGVLVRSGDVRQTNIEGGLVSWVQEAREKASGIIINAASTDWCSSEGMGSEDVKKITLNMIHKWLKKENVFSTEGVA